MAHHSTVPQSIKRRLLPAILAYSQAEAQKKLDFIKENYPSAYLHVDAMDGKLVAATCWGKPAQLQKLAITQPFEMHLITQHPERHIAGWKKAGATRILFHIESTDNPEAVISAIKAHHMEVGVALNPDTPLDVIRLILPRIDAILVMGVVPGYAGQEFIPSVLQKIKHLRKLAPKQLIIVDGGVTLENAPRLIKAGADQLVSTSAVYGKNFANQQNA
ncbi:MAG: ribulose-phosphate 3-epimerase [bacterium]|nr:ribulose-phosphate 3-epimerase [bacterium]